MNSAVRDSTSTLTPTPTPISLLTLPAPAKINHFLRVLQQRPDGYHDLQTVFQFLGWSDRLQFQRRTDGKITVTCSLPELNQPDNLIYRAAQAMQAICATRGRDGTETGSHRGTGRHSETQYGCDIICEKRIPVGSGLGGGSSDAATTLHALNILWQCGLSPTQLATIGLQLGADVPIFVAGHAAWAEGVGEHLTAMALPTAWCVILNPNVPVSTAQIFRHHALARGQTPYPRGHIPANHQNDCQALVCQLYPEIDQALKWLSRYNTAWLTGTGCAIVSAFETRAAAEDVIAQIPAPWSGIVAQTCNTSPLLTALNAL